MIGIFIILIVNLMVCCEGFNPYSLSSVMGSSGIPGDWRGHVLRCLPPALMASITAGVSNSRMPSCREKSGRAPAVTVRPEEAFTTDLPVLTQIEMVFHENSFGALLTPYSSGF